nr:DNA repair protein RadC [Acuticoccus sediminis]
MAEQDRGTERVSSAALTLLRAAISAHAAQSGSGQPARKRASPTTATPPETGSSPDEARRSSETARDDPAASAERPARLRHPAGDDPARHPEANQAELFGEGPDASARAGGDEGQRRISVDLSSGHRDRLRARFDRGETLPEYELLELLLFRSIPRRDTKPIAKALIAEFGSFAAVLAAPAARLMDVSGVGERVVGDFRLIRAAAERLTHDALADRVVLSSTDAVVDFYRARLRGLEREEFHVLYLDKKNKMLVSECAGAGTVDHTPVYPREVLKRALELGASAIVLIHNHPSGDPAPSRADIAVTAKIIDGARPLGLAVHDHIIIGANTYISLRSEGYV